MFRYVKVDMSSSEDRLILETYWVGVSPAGTSRGMRQNVAEILTFTLVVANLNMTVRQSDPGKAGGLKRRFGPIVTALLPSICMLAEYGVWWRQREVMRCVREIWC